jgi:hypothetical protein
MDVEAVSEVFTTDEGFNIIMVANRRERVERTYQQMKGSVLRKVKNEKLAEMYEQYTDNLQTSGTVNVDEAKLSATEVGAARRGAPAALGPDGAGLTPPSLPTLGGAGEDGAAPNGAEGAEGAEGAGKDAPSGDKEGDK